MAGPPQFGVAPSCMFSAAAVCGPCGDERTGTWSFPSGAGRRDCPASGAGAPGRQRHGRVRMLRQGRGKNGEGVGSRVRDRRDQGPGAAGPVIRGLVNSGP